MPLADKSMPPTDKSIPPADKSMPLVDKLLPPKGGYVFRVLLELRFQRQERKFKRLEELQEQLMKDIIVFAQAWPEVLQ